MRRTEGPAHILGVHSLPYWADLLGFGGFALVMLAAGTWSFARME